MRKTKHLIVEVANPPKNSSHRTFGPSTIMTIGNFPPAPYQVDLIRYLGVACGLANPLHTGIVWAGAFIDPRAIRALTAADIVTVQQTTRTNLLAKTERDDLTLVYGTYAAGAAGDQAVLAAGGAGIKHKVYACGYTVDAAVQTGFRFNNANPRFCVRRTAGVYAQSFPNPVVSAANVTLSLRVEGASNGDFWAQYVSEA